MNDSTNPTPAPDTPITKPSTTTTPAASAPAEPKVINIEYLGTRGDPLVVPATNKRTWSTGDESEEPEEIALELIEQTGFRRKAKAPAAM